MEDEKKPNEQGPSPSETAKATPATKETVDVAADKAE